MGGADDEIRSGSFRNPLDAQGVLALPIMGELRPEHLDPISLSVLLVRRLARRSISGTLTLERKGTVVEMPILGGVAYMRNPEKVAVMRAFGWPEGSYLMGVQPPNPEKRSRFSMGRLVMEGLRSVVRGFNVSDMEQALGDKLQMAPKVRTDRAYVLELGLTEPEKRLVRLQMDGGRSVDDIVSRSGIGRQTTLQLLFLLVVFDCLEWKQPEITEEKSLAEELEQLAERMEKVNHFEALDVHWSLGSEDIELIYKKLRKKLERGGRWDRTAPEACERMRRRAEEAYEVLSVPVRRADYRKQVYPDIYYEAASQLVDGQIKSYQLRIDKTGLKDAVRTKQELARGAVTDDAPSSSDGKKSK